MYNYDGRKDRPRCADCGVYVSYDADQYTPYGCANPEAPEPYDPSYLCKKCSKADYKNWLKHFKNGGRYGNWSKSNGEIRAAKECGLAYVGSSGVGTLSTADWADAYQYITQVEYDRLSALPYWGYCKICGKEMKNAYCSDDSCIKSFKSKSVLV